jgi:hypothetical protein
MCAPTSAIHRSSHKLHRIDLADRISFDVPKHVATRFQAIGAESGQHLSHDHTALFDLLPPLASAQPTHSLCSSSGLTATAHGAAGWHQQWIFRLTDTPQSINELPIRP